MKVKFKTIDAGPAGVRQPGSVVEVSEAEGKALLEGGYAELVEPAKKAKKEKAEVQPNAESSAETSTETSAEGTVA